jgi:magnesium transporter
MTADPSTARPTPAADHPADAGPGGDDRGAGTGRLWSPAGMVDRDVHPAEVWKAFQGGPEARAWLFLPRKDSQTLRTAARRLEIDELAIEDLLGAHEPVKLDWVGRSMVAVLRSVRYDADAGALEVHPVSLLAGHRAVLVLADDAVRVDLCGALDGAERQIVADGVPEAIHTIVDHLVDGYAAAVEALEDAVGTLSESLFQDRPLRRDEQLEAFRVQRALSQLRRSTRPVRDVTAGLANAAGRGNAGRSAGDEGVTDTAEALLGARSLREFSDVADHADHVAQAADSVREAMTSMYETNLALADVHLNTVMKKLTGWAAIIAVPTLITGFMGMNVPYPGFGTKAGFVVALAIMVSAVVTLYVTLRRKDWI